MQILRLIKYRAPYYQPQTYCLGLASMIPFLIYFSFASFNQPVIFAIL